MGNQEWKDDIGFSIAMNKYIDEIYKELENKDSKLRKEFSASVIKKLEDGKENAFPPFPFGFVFRDVNLIVPLKGAI